MSESKEVADWKSALAADAEKVAKEERPGNSVISLKSGIMTYQDQPIPDNKLECVVIATSYARTWFDRPYDPDDVSPPECFANALEQAELIPHINVSQPPSAVCSEKACEYAVFGSAKQGNGPACKTRRKLMVMPVSGLENPAEAEMAVIAAPPTSGKNWATYANRIASGSGLPPWAVTTTIVVKPHPKKQFEVTFEAGAPITDEATLAALHGRIAEAEAILLTPYTYEAEAPAEEAPAKKSKKY